MSRRCQRLLLAPLLGLLAAAGVDAQQSDDSQPFIESVNVNVVNVDVRVTDKDGEPVEGLTVDDFEIFEEGRPVKISNFYVVENGRRLDPETVPKVDDDRPQLPESANLRKEIEPVSDEERLLLVIFFDNYNVRPLERNRVIDNVMQFVRSTIRSGDLVTLVTYDRALNIRQHFTDDLGLIEDGLRDLEKLAGHKVLRDRERQEALRVLDDTNNSEIALSAVTRYAEMVYNEMGFTVQGLSQMVDFLAGIPGRKALLHVSGGMPMVVGSDLFAAVEQKFEGRSALNSAARYDLSRRFDQVAEHANANAVTFYTVDAGGLRANTAGAAEHQGLGTAGLSFRIESDYEANLQTTLYHLARETGGQAIVNQNNIFPALRKVGGDLRTFYSLGFEPSHHGDGRYYSLKVEVKRKNIVVRHRAGYRDKSQETVMIEGTMAALLHSYQLNPIGAALGVGKGALQEDKNYLVPIEARVPIDSIVFFPDGETYSARLRIYLSVLDDRGRTSEVQQRPVGIKLDADAFAAAKGEFYIHRQQLMMRPGRHKIAIGINDEQGGGAAFIAGSVFVGE